MFRLLLLPALLALSACSTETAEAPKDTKPKDTKAPACDLAYDKLADTVWLRLAPENDGKPEVKSRVKFFSEGGTLKAKYTAGSVGDVFTYVCTEKGGMLDCLEEDKHLEAFCKAYAAVHGGKCDAAVLAPMLGVTEADLKPVADKVNAELGKLSKAETEQQRKVDNNPNLKIRSHFVLALDKSKCQVTLQDKFISMYNGNIQEYENQNGTTNFGKDTGEYFWDACTDPTVQITGEDGKAVSPPFSAGTLKFTADAGKEKASAACTYTADIWRDWQKLSGDLPGEVKGGSVIWTSPVNIDGKGIHAVYFDRYKTCDGKKERIGVACKGFRVE